MTTKPIALLASLLVALGSGSSALATKASLHCGVELDRPVLPAGSQQNAIIKVLLDAPDVPKEAERPAVNLTLVIDRSGSMSGSKMTKAKEAAIEAIRRLVERDLFSLVVYDHEVETLVPPQSASYTEWIEGRIRGISPRGNTALFGAVSQGAAENRKHSEGAHVNRIILLSDGLANVGPSSPADLARLGAALLKEGISVTTIGVGTDFNEDLMVQLAERSDGNHYFVESSRDLPRIFAAELGDVLSVVARKVIIEIECPDGVRPVRIIGREGQIRDNKAQIQMNQLYGGQQKYALIEVAVPPGEVNVTRELAVAHISYQNALTETHETAKADAQVRFSGRQEEVRKWQNLKVQTEVVSNIQAEIRDEALDLYNAGKTQEAADYIEVNRQALQQDFADAPGVQEATDSLGEQAEEFEQQKVTGKRKKEIRSDSYRTRTQQKSWSR